MLISPSNLPEDKPALMWVLKHEGETYADYRICSQEEAPKVAAQLYQHALDTLRHLEDIE